MVVNLAAQAGVRYSITNPDAYVESNLVGFFNILEACRHCESLEHLVYASSSSVYGSNKKVPYSTDYVDTYFDNGFTGTNFKRPAFTRLMNDVRQKKIKCIQMLLYWNIMLNYADLNLNQSGQYGQIYAEKFTSASLICKVFYGKMKAQWGKYTLLLNLL